MVSQISAGVKITVHTYYQPEYSNLVENEFRFAYKILIENNNNFAIKLLSRHWFIYDSNASFHEVQGDGVVGVQPQINPGKFYQYTSGCHLKTEMGKMLGSYVMQNTNNKKTFIVHIPTFKMCAPFKLN